MMIFLGQHTSFAQLSREKRLSKEQHRTLSEGILYVIHSYLMDRTEFKEIR